MQSMKHIEFSQLVDKFEAGSSPMEVEEIRSHLAECSDCRAESEHLTDFFAYVAENNGEPVPQAVTARILNIYQRRPLPIEPIVESPIANGFLIFDDWSMAVNERHSGLDSRQMLYRVGNFEIELRFEFLGDTCGLAGQVFPELPQAAAEIVSATATQTTIMNELGEFCFEPVPHDRYCLRITLGNEEILIDDLPMQC
ncbi:hypothetical protein BH10ACI2_BH10ACI2_19950 [soil metagenome]